MEQHLSHHMPASPEQEQNDSAAQLLLDVVDSLHGQRHWLDDVNTVYNDHLRHRGGVRFDVLTVGAGEQARHVSLHWDADGNARLALVGSKSRSMKYVSSAESLDEQLHKHGVDSSQAVLPILYAVLRRHANLPGGANFVERAEKLNLQTEGSWRTPEGKVQGATYLASNGRILRVDTAGAETSPSRETYNVRELLAQPQAVTLLKDAGPTARVTLTRQEHGNNLLLSADGKQVEVLPHLAERLEAAEQTLDGFINNPGLDMLANLHGIELPEDHRERLRVLKELAGQWDFRAAAGGSKERQAVDWGDGLDARVEKAARLLGQVDSSRPVNTMPKVGIILGGANRAPLDRTQYLRMVASPDMLVYAGSSRPVNQLERNKAADYTIYPTDEADLGRGAFRTALGARMMRGGSTQRTGEDARSWQEYVYADWYTGEEKQAFVLSTPYEFQTAGAKRRATTYDNAEGVATEPHLGIQEGDTVVQVTTQLYAPSQHLAAIEVLTLGHGIQVETIGHDAAFSGAKRTTRQYLQEAKAAIDAAVHLQARIDTLTASV